MAASLAGGFTGKLAAQEAGQRCQGWVICGGVRLKVREVWCDRFPLRTRRAATRLCGQGFCRVQRTKLWAANTHALKMGQLQSENGRKPGNRPSRTRINIVVPIPMDLALACLMKRKAFPDTFDGSSRVCDADVGE